MPPSDLTPASGDNNGDVVDLLSRARDGSTVAINQLLNGFRPYLKRIADAQLDTPLQPKFADSDVVQETFMKAFANFDEFRGQTEEELRSWLVRILQNNVHDCIRAFLLTDKRNIQREVSLDRSSIGPEVEASDRPAANAARREEEDVLRDKIERLPNPERQVVLWYYEEQVPFAVIARRLNCSAETARRHWYRAVEMLGNAMT